MISGYTKRELSAGNRIEHFLGVVFPAIVLLPFGVIGGITIIFLLFTGKTGFLHYLFLGLDIIGLAFLYVLHCLIIYGPEQVVKSLRERICAGVVLVLGIFITSWLSWFMAGYVSDAVKFSKNAALMVFPVLSLMFTAGPAIVGMKYLFELLKENSYGQRGE